MGHKKGGESSAHKYLAVSKIDHKQNAVNQRVPQGNEGVNAALCQTKYEEIKPLLTIVLGNSQRGDSAADNNENNDYFEEKKPAINEGKTLEHIVGSDEADGNAD